MARHIRFNWTRFKRPNWYYSKGLKFKTRLCLYVNSFEVHKIWRTIHFAIPIAFDLFFRLLTTQNLPTFRLQIMWLALIIVIGKHLYPEDFNYNLKVTIDFFNAAQERILR